MLILLHGVVINIIQDQGMLPDVLCMKNTMIYHDLQDGGVTIKNAVSRWNLYLIPLRELKAGKSVIYQYSLAPYLASVEMFDEIGMDAIIEKEIKSRVI
jgi:hypothetical protein